MIHYDSQPETNSRLVLLETVTNKRIFNREKKRLARKYCSQIQPNDEKRERSDAKRPTNLTARANLVTLKEPIINTEAKRCFATHDEDIEYLKNSSTLFIQSHAYIFNRSNLFNNVPMAHWSTFMPCNREAAGSNLSGVLAFF